MSYWMYDDYGDEIFDPLVRSVKAKRDKNYLKIEREVRKYSNNELCEEYFKNYKDKEKLNKIYRNSSFPAYDVAITCYENDKMSRNQRKALENILIEYSIRKQGGN